MINLQNIKYFFIALIFINLHAQTEPTENLNKADKLLEKKIEFNKSLGVANRWKVQVFNGKLDDSKNAYVDFKKKFNTIDATIVFTNDQYKVWVGNCRTRIETEKILAEIKKQYPNAFLVKPKIN